MDPMDLTAAQITEQIDGLIKLAVAGYESLVDSILRGDITDLRFMEAIMDGLAGFVDYPPCLVLYEKLCAYVSHIDPQLAEEHKAMTLSDSDMSSL
jgi:hypothetical protein